MGATATSRYSSALLALHGLSIGDAFGQQFFVPEDEAITRIHARQIPPSPWTYTDDTLMAASVCDVLARSGQIHQDELAVSFWQRYQAERGYGATMRRLLADLAAGQDWQVASRALFCGIGSHGNGAAMRVAPLGAYFCDDLDRTADEAVKSAVVTHAHPEGIAGAVAVAVASALACALGRGAVTTPPARFLELVAGRVPDGAVRRGIETAASLPDDASVRLAVAVLGNGIQLSAADTVPFALWSAAKHLGRFEDAMWVTVSGLGDRDTTCAMVGAIVALSAGADGVPAAWLQFREPLPDWVPQDAAPVSFLDNQNDAS